MANDFDELSVSIQGGGQLPNLRVVSLSGREEVSRPFRYELRLVGVKGSAQEGTLQPKEVLGEPITVTVQSPMGLSERHFSGIITEFAHTGFDEDHHEYSAVIRPKLWLLTQSSDCRILKDRTTIDIFGTVVNGLFEHRLALKADAYKPWKQRVQYHETDFDFLSRLLELEGIFYYFEHHKGRHVMVLADDVSQLKPVESYEVVEYAPHGERVAANCLTSLSSSSAIRSSGYAARGYDFEKPSAFPRAASSAAPQKNVPSVEIFEYMADEEMFEGADRFAKVRAQRFQSTQHVIRASGHAVGLAAGRVTTLTRHPVESLNVKYMVVATEILLQGSGESLAYSDFHIDVELLDAREPYRPEMLTPKPRIHGTQTAMVLGVNGSDISTDKHGRVQVKFHWLREEQSSGLVRVAQGWAGQGWGMQLLPRAGQEVVVSFIDGDPDEPLIIGSVYNGTQTPPYPLPDENTRSGWRSRSFGEGANAAHFNEIRFEDKKGEEELYIHAEKNMQVVVENNQTITIGADKKDPGDRSVTIHNDDTLEVGQDRKVTVKKNLVTTVKENEERNVEKGRKTVVTENDELTVRKKFTLTATDEIQLEVGLSKIVMKKDGTIEISGKDVKVKGTTTAELSSLETKVAGTAKVEVDSVQTAISGTQLELKGTATSVQGTGSLDLASSAIASLKGTITKIG
jgi:type VI secretion system secreted protein VgrG